MILSTVYKSIIITLPSLLFLCSSPVHSQNQNTSIPNVTEPWTTWSTKNLNDYSSIVQTINLDAICADTKNWTLIPQYFAQNATASYHPTTPTLHGIEEITNFITNALNNLTAQHLHGTQMVDISDDAQTANATTFAQATLFADPFETPGQVAYIYGFYNDRLIKTSDGWRIIDRVYRFMGPGVAGNLTLLGM